MRIIKSLLVALTVGITVFAVLTAVFPESGERTYTADTVRCFVTKRGEHYHFLDCKYLDDTDIFETNTVQATIDGYHACNYCKDDLYSFKYHSGNPTADPETIKATIVDKTDEKHFSVSTPTAKLSSVASALIGFTITFFVCGDKKNKIKVQQ